eukprot:GEMP01006647.1.p1 GENE.GEMP01006647.1~~GEMP01006647.1.p1  ORF type:complete len:846 (+),score=276.04 GEMP01006647.1:72-2609(+)
MEHRLDGVRKRVEMLRSSLASVQNRREALAMAINQCNWARGSFEEALEVKAATLKSEVDAQVKREKALITEKARRYCVPLTHEKNDAENQIQHVAQLIRHVRRNLELETVESLDDELNDALAELEMGEMEYGPLDVMHFGPLPGWKLLLDSSRRLARPQSSKVRKHKRCEDDGWVYDDTEGEWTHRKDLSRPQSAKGRRGYIDIESDDSWVYNDEAGSSEAQAEEDDHRYWTRRPMREQRRTRMRPRDDRRSDDHFRAQRTTAAQRRPFLPATIDDGDPLILYEDDSDGDSYTRPRPLGELLTATRKMRPGSRPNYAAMEALASSRPEVGHRRRDVVQMDALVPPAMCRSWARAQREARDGVEEMEGVAGYRSGGSARQEQHKSPHHVAREEMEGQMDRRAAGERRMHSDMVDRNVPVHRAHREEDERTWRTQQVDRGHATSSRADARAIQSSRRENIGDGDVQVEYGVQQHGPMLNGTHERSSAQERELRDRLQQQQQQEPRPQQHQQPQQQPQQQSQRSPHAPPMDRSGGAAGSPNGVAAGYSKRNAWPEEDLAASTAWVQHVHASDEQRSPTASSSRSAGFVHSTAPLDSVLRNGVYRTPARQRQQELHTMIPTALLYRGVRSDRPQSSKERKHKRCEEEDGWVYEDHVEPMGTAPCANNGNNHHEQPQQLSGEDDFADLPEPRWRDPATHRLRLRTPCHVSLLQIAREEDTLPHPREAMSVRCFLSNDGSPTAPMDSAVGSPLNAVAADDNARHPTCAGTHFFDVALTSNNVTVGELLQDVGPLATGYYATHADGVMLFVRTHQSGLPLPLAEEEKVTVVLNEWKNISEEGWPRLFLLPAA